MSTFPGILVLASIALVAVLVSLRRPEIGALLATGVFYVNLLPIAMRYHGVSPLLAVGTLALVVPALVKILIFDREGLIVDFPFLLMLLFLASTILSSMLSQELEASLPWVIRYIAEGMIVYLLTLNLVRRQATLRRYAWVLLLSGAFLSTLTIYQDVTHSYTNDFGGLAMRQVGRDRLLEDAANRREIVRDTQRGQGPDMDANRYAQILIVLLPLGLCLLRSARHAWQRLAATLCSLLTLGGILLTYSRGAFVGLLVMLGVMKLLRIVTLKQVVVLSLAMVIGIAALSPALLSRFDKLGGLRNLTGSGAQSAVTADIAARERASAMLAAWRVFLDHPILGVGPDQFAARYVIDYMAESSPDLAGRHFLAHSLYLGLAAETGVIGLGIFLWIVATTLWRLRTAREADPQAPQRDWPGALAAAVVAYMVTGLFLHLSYQRYFWLLLGLAGAAVQIARADAEGARPARGSFSIPAR